MKAIIIGGGIGGLTTAIALQQQGIEVVVYERVPELRAIGAGLSLWANALRAFDTIGIGNKLRAMGISHVESGIRSADGTPIAVMSGQELRQNFGETPLLVVHRGDLLDLLSQNAGAVLRYGCAFERYVQSADKVTVTFADGSIDTGDILIGADGIHSRVRGQMLPMSQPVYSGYTAWRSVIHFDHKRVQEMWGESWGIGQRSGILPLTDNRVYWFATANRPQNETLSPEENHTLLQDLFANWHHPMPELIAQSQPEDILRNDIIDLEPITNWLDKRVVLLGDSAHAMTPNMGQGACQAIEDAIVLARALSCESASLTEKLARYVHARQTRTRQIQMQSRRIGNMGQVENAVLCWLRNQTMRNLPKTMQIRMLKPVVNYDVATVTI